MQIIYKYSNRYATDSDSGKMYMVPLDFSEFVKPIFEANPNVDYIQLAVNSYVMKDSQTCLYENNSGDKCYKSFYSLAINPAGIAFYKEKLINSNFDIKKELDLNLLERELLLLNNKIKKVRSDLIDLREQLVEQNDALTQLSEFEKSQEEKLKTISLKKECPECHSKLTNELAVKSRKYINIDNAQALKDTIKADTNLIKYEIQDKEKEYSRLILALERKKLVAKETNAYYDDCVASHGEETTNDETFNAKETAEFSVFNETGKMFYFRFNTKQPLLFSKLREINHGNFL